MATKARRVILYLSVFAIALLAAGCLLPRTSEAPLISPSSPSRDFNLSDGQTERFRIEKNGSTPEYSIKAEHVVNLTSAFIINPGGIVFALAERQAELVDLDRDGTPDLVVSMKNTTGPVAYITITLAGSAQICTTQCPAGKLQYPYPDCSCYTPVQNCSSACPANQSQRPYPDCACFTATQFCADQTPYGSCSATKPKFCQVGELVDKCGTCGCQAGKNCNATSGACYTPPAAQSPTPAPSPGASPSPTVTPPPADEAAAAIAAANATAEGGLAARYDTLYRKNRDCSESAFTSTFQSRKGRPPTASELAPYRSTKGYLPMEVSVTAPRSGSNYNVTYSAVGGGMPGPMLKIVVAPPSSIISSNWQGVYASGCGGGSATQCNQELIEGAEAVSGNCGLVFKLNGW